MPPVDVGATPVTALIARGRCDIDADRRTSSARCSHHRPSARVTAMSAQRLRGEHHQSGSDRRIDDAATAARHDRIVGRRRGHVPGHDQSRFRRGLDLPGPGPVEQRTGRRLGVGARRGYRGTRRRLRVAQGGLSSAGARVQRARRRAQLVAARRRPLYRIGRVHPGVPFRSGSLYQSRAVAPPAPPSRHAELLQALGRAAGALRAGQLQRLPAAAMPSAANRSASAPSRRIIRATSRSSSQKRPGARSSTRRSARKIRNACSSRCATGARSTRTMRISRARRPASGAASRRVRAEG